MEKRRREGRERRESGLAVAAMKAGVEEEEEEERAGERESNSRCFSNKCSKGGRRVGKRKESEGEQWMRKGKGGRSPRVGEEEGEGWVAVVVASFLSLPSCCLYGRKEKDGSSMWEDGRVSTSFDMAFCSCFCKVNFSQHLRVFFGQSKGNFFRA